MPSKKLTTFRLLTDALRESRRVMTESEHEQERSEEPLLAKLADLIDSMEDSDREIANSEGWRGWPDSYDARMRQCVETIDPDDPSCAGDPPRRLL